MLERRSASFRFHRARHGVFCCMALVTSIWLASNSTSAAAEESQLSSLTSNEVWFPDRNFPRLTTPQWVGDNGVECIVVLAIDDMRDPAKYEAYFRPILQRLKAIDGRAPISIMTCAVKPDDPQLQSWLQEGLSLECHTFDHPCPLLADSDFAKSKGTFDKCVDLLGAIPNSKPVAFRMPCCDSLNTVSPRFYSEIFNKTTAAGNFLQLDSSVFMLYTADDPLIPRELLVDPDGNEKLRKYIPRRLKRGDQVFDTFVNTIENYPYPYVIQNRCWEFPCMVPSDWSANHLHQPNNPDTVRDLKAALDITVVKQGVMNLVFHPHGWIKAEQVVDLIDHAVAKHGKKVKFLTFKECVDRLNNHLLAGQSLRDVQGNDNGARLIDVNEDSYIDVVIANSKVNVTRTWSPREKKWIESAGPVAESVPDADRHMAHSVIWWTPGSVVGRSVQGLADRRFFQCNSHKWTQDTLNDFGLPAAIQAALGDASKVPHAMELRDLDHDGVPEFVVQGPTGVMKVIAFQPQVVNKERSLFRTLDWFPPGLRLRDDQNKDTGLRFVDLNGDGHLDLVRSNSSRYGAWLFESKEKGWSIPLMNAERGSRPVAEELLPIIRADGSDNGFFVKDRHLCWINEDTSASTDFLIRVSFDQVLGDRLPDPKSPTTAIKSMRVKAGFQIDLVAHEPMTKDPVAFDWGGDGKLWVAEMADYPLGIDGHGKPGGRVRFLVDLDGDGHYDKSTLFLEDVPYPNGVIAWKKGVLVSAAPDIFYAEDTDGDGKADRRELLFTGFAEGNQQHRVNGFTRGLDNWLYLANGDSGGTVVSTKTKQTLDLRGRDVRIRPDTGEMEAVAGLTQFGRNRDDWGNWFGNNNSRPMWHYVLDDHYLRRNSSLAAPHHQHDVSITPGAAPVFPSSKTLTRFNDFHTANRFTSACGTIVYRDDVLFGPKSLAANPSAHVFVSEPVHNLVHHEVMTADGATFTSQRPAGEEQSEFVSSTDNWFRPTMLRTGPDGGLWIADMYRLVIEHPQWIPIEWQRKLNVRAGDDKGRIWRVLPVGIVRPEIPRFDRLTTAELVAALDHSNGCRRDLVQQLLIEQADPAGIPLLRRQAKSSNNPACRLQSLCALDGLKGGLSPDVITAALSDPHPAVRRHAIRLSESNKDIDTSRIAQLSKLVGDPDIQVRLQLAYSLGEFADTRTGELLGQLALSASGDPYLIAAVMSSLNRANLSEVLGVVAKSGTTQTELLEQLLGQATAFDDQPSLVSLLTRATEPAANGQFARWQYEAFEQFLTALSRSGKSLDGWLGKLTADNKSLAPRIKTLLTAAQTLAKNTEANLQDRVAAVRILGQSNSANDDLNLLADVVSPQQPPEIQAAALTAMSRMTSPKIASILLANFRSFGAARRTQICDILFSREPWQDELLAALESRQLSPSDLDAASRQRLLTHRSNPVRERAAKVLAVSVNTDRGKLVAEYLPQIRSHGDPQHGSQLFKKTCSQCHKLGSVGTVVGPDLTSMNDKSAEALLTAILDPNRAVESRYLTFTAVTKNGVTHTGIIASETASSLTLRAAEGKEVTLLRNELDELQSTAKSLMPEGLERDLKPTDAASLIAYIRQNVPLPAMKQFPGNDPRVIKPDASHTLTLTPFEAEVYGPTIVIEEQHRNLGWWSSADDLVVWTVDVPAAGKYSVSWTWACDPQAAGNSVTVEAMGKSFTRPVTKTASWDDYQTTTLGELELPQGEVRLTLKPASRPLPALGDVQSVVLKPVR